MSLIVPAIVFSVEAVITTVWLNHPDRRHTDKTAYRLAELVVLLVTVRFYTWGASGSWPQFALLRNYLNTPLDLLSDPFFHVGVLLTGLTWWYTIAAAGIFSRLAIDGAEVAYYASPPSMREPGNRPIALDRARLVERWLQRWFWGAVVLAISIAVTTLDLTDVASPARLRTIGRMELRPASLVTLVVYIFSGLLLLSQARLAAMNARWLIGGSIKDERVEKSWYRNSIWLLVAVAIVAALLPMGSTPAAGGLLRVVLEGVVSLFGMVAALFFGLISMLFPRSAGSLESSQSPEGPASATALPPSGQPNEIVSFIFSSFFWALAIFVTVSACLFYFRDRTIPISSRLLAVWWRAFGAWVRGLFMDASAQAKLFGDTIRDFRARVDGRRVLSRARFSFVRFNDLSPRQQLRYIFLSTVRRAMKRGLERQPSETPLEFAQELKDQLPGSESEVDLLTDAFLKARYSQSTVQPEEVSAIRRPWKQLLTRLRRRS
jgi:hypothetical protein